MLNSLLQKQKEKGREKAGETEEERRQRQSPRAPARPEACAGGQRHGAGCVRGRKPLGLRAGARKNVTHALPL